MDMSTPLMGMSSQLPLREGFRLHRQSAHAPPCAGTKQPEPAPCMTMAARQFQISVPPESATAHIHDAGEKLIQPQAN
eukprot:1848696-Prorocentrum_lima.AAC.1